MKSKNLTSWLLLPVISLMFTSCYKKFDPNSYAPDLEIGGYTSSSEIAPSNLVAYWPFDGDVNDKVGGIVGDNTGTSFGPGYKGQALQGALNSYVLANPTASITGLNSFTITMWVNSPAPSNGVIGMVSLAKTDGFWGNIETFFENGSTSTNGKFRAHIQNGASEAWVSKDGIVNLFDTWVAIAVSYNAANSTFKLYINGSSIYTNVVGGFGPINFTNTGKLVFGCVQFQTNPSQTSATGSQSWASYLTGRLDEVRIYNAALTDADVGALVLLEGRGK